MTEEEFFDKLKSVVGDNPHHLKTWSSMKMTEEEARIAHKMSDRGEIIRLNVYCYTTKR